MRLNPTLLPFVMLVPGALAQDCTPPLTSVSSVVGDFGAAVAGHGRMLVVGAPLSDLVPGAPPLYPYGRAEVFEFDPSASAWTAIDVLGPPPSQTGFPSYEGFASAIAIGDQTLFFGWPDDILGGNGTVRPYRRATLSGAWVPEAPIRPPFQSATGRFGVTVAAGDGLLAVGEQLSSGLVHIHARSGGPGDWQWQQTLVPPPPGSLTGTFGRAIAVQGDWIFVGDPGHPGALQGSGHVYTFKRDSLGTWQFIQRLSALNSDPLVADGFGVALAVVPPPYHGALDPGTLLVGANQDRSSPGMQTGAAYVFDFTTPTSWTRSQILYPPAGAGDLAFGSSIAGSGSGHGAIVGAPRNPGATGLAGAAFLLERDPVTGDWRVTERITHGAAGVARTGAAVAMGDWQAAVGAPGLASVRATPAFPLRDVDGDQVLDACEALHAPTTCPSIPNASGMIGRIHVEGTAVISGAATELWADQLTLDSFGYFITSRAYQVTLLPGQQVFGVLCLGAEVGRFNGAVLNAGAVGRVHLTIDPGQLPQPTGAVSAQPGETWFFQYWHRDLPPVGQQISNFTEAARVTFE